MKNKPSRAVLLTMLLLLYFVSASGQGNTEFLVTVNPATGILTKVDSLPGVKWVHVGPRHTTFDDNGHRFIFKGSDNVNDRLYTVDAISGSILSNPVFPVLSDPYDRIVELEYDDVTDKLYGLFWDNSEDQYYLANINTTTGVHALIDSLPGILWFGMTGSTTFDKVNHRYIFRGVDPGGINHFYSVDVITGSIVSSPVCPSFADPADKLRELEFDNSTNTLFALYRDNSASKEYLVSIDPATALYTIIDTLPGVHMVLAGPRYTVFDEINHRYIFSGYDTSLQGHLYSVDAGTGAILLDPSFPILPNPAFENIIEMECDKTTGILYALHWGLNMSTGIFDAENEPSFNIFPNPFSSDSKIMLGIAYRETVIFIYNSTGQLVKHEVVFNTLSIDLKRENLPAGIYYVSIVADDEHVGVRKMVIE